MKQIRVDLIVEVPDYESYQEAYNRIFSWEGSKITTPNFYSDGSHTVGQVRNYPVTKVFSVVGVHDE